MILHSAKSQSFVVIIFNSIKKVGDRVCFSLLINAIDFDTVIFSVIKYIYNIFYGSSYLQFAIMQSRGL